MQRENPSILKTKLRRHFLSLRQSISAERRQEAAINACSSILKKGKILSFYSFGSEIDLSLLNHTLLLENRLLLPRIENDSITPYQVFDLSHSLQKSSFGVFEPNPDRSSKLSLGEIDLILVPGLAFDRECFRLGYGKGHYDRFLSNIKTIESLGIAFREQRAEELLPRDPWDIPLTNCLFF